MPNKLDSDVFPIPEKVALRFVSKMWNILYRTARILIIPLLILTLALWSFRSTYRYAQINTCNTMLRLHPDTKDFGLYCEDMDNGIHVRSTVLKKSTYNLTIDRPIF